MYASEISSKHCLLSWKSESIGFSGLKTGPAFTPSQNQNSRTLGSEGHSGFRGRYQELAQELRERFSTPGLGPSPALPAGRPWTGHFTSQSSSCLKEHHHHRYHGTLCIWRLSPHAALNSPYLTRSPCNESRGGRVYPYFTNEETEAGETRLVSEN